MQLATIELSSALVTLAEQYITARRRSGESLLEAAGYLAQARAVADYGEWLPFLSATGTSPDTAEQLLNIHERATFDRAFADAVKNNWLSQTTAGLLARPGTPQEVIDQVLGADTPPSRRDVQEAIKQAANTDPDRYFEEDDEPLSDYEQRIADNYKPAVEYVPAPAMSQPMSLLTSQGTVEWYTPPEIIERGRAVMGGIDLDPASSDVAQRWIQAGTYYQLDLSAFDFDKPRANDAELKRDLARFSHAQLATQPPWAGRVWLNPPFDNADTWVDRLDSEYIHGDVTSAVLLVNSAPGYIWWENLWRRRPVCMLRERVCFWTPDGQQNEPSKKGTTIAYYGDDVQSFIAQFGDLGRVILPED
jgi:hypothetical protein